MTMKKIIRIIRTLQKYPIEFFLGTFAVLLSHIIAVWAYKNGLMLILADQSSHLNFARLLTDSITPGISQLGTWPPLLHIVMAPYAAIQGLYNSGFAGFFGLAPFFAMSVILFYKLLLRLLDSVFFSVCGTLIYMTNPFVLYYSATPMMEILLICFVISATYFCIRWIEENRLKDLMFTGVSIVLASLARFEGLLLLPLISLIIFIQLLRKKYGYYRIEATLILFWFIACVGLITLMVYDFVYFKNPLIFINIGEGPAWGLPPTATTTVPVEQVNSFVMFLHASYYMLSMPIVLLSFASAFLVLLLCTHRRFNLAVALVLLSVPALSVLINTARGTSGIFVPEFSQMNDFHNVRYALTWIGAASFALVALPVILMERFNSRVMKIVAILLLTTSITASGMQFYEHAIATHYSIVKRDRSAPPVVGRYLVGVYLNEHYSHGMIFMNRYGNDRILIDAQLPLSHYIYEGNDKYYTQTITRPWMFAQFVVMTDPETLRLNSSNSPITDLWWNSPEFLSFYDQAFESGGYRVYHLNEDAVRAYAIARNIPVDQIPSLNEHLLPWNPQDQMIQNMITW